MVENQNSAKDEKEDSGTSAVANDYNKIVGDADLNYNADLVS